MVALMMLSTALKDLAVEMNLFIMSSTQTNAKAEDDNRTMKNESVIRGARSIIDKCDLACVISRVTKEEEDLLSTTIERCGKIPNQVMDIYKVRRGRYTNVRIWSFVDLGTCRKEDLFITNDKMEVIEDFEVMDFDYEDRAGDDQIREFIGQLNEQIESSEIADLEELDEEAPQEISIEQIIEEDNRQKGMFGDLI